MKNKISHQGLFALTALILTLCGVILLTLCYLSAYDVAIGYFSADSLLPLLGTLFALLFTLGITGGAILLYRKDGKELTLHDPLWFRTVSALVGIGFLAMALTDLKASASLLPVLVGAMAAIHFLIRALKPTLHLPLVLTGIFVIVRLALAIGQLYFNWEIPMNAPVKIYLQLGAVAGMVFLLREWKATVVPSHSLLTPIALGLGTLFTGLSSLPILIARQKGALGEIAISPVPFLLFLLWIYCLARMLTLFRAPEATAEEPVAESEGDTEATAKSEADPLAESENDLPSEESETDPS